MDRDGRSAREESGQRVAGREEQIDPVTAGCERQDRLFPQKLPDALLGHRKSGRQPLREARFIKEGIHWDVVLEVEIVFMRLVLLRLHVEQAQQIARNPRPFMFQRPPVNPDPHWCAFPLSRNSCCSLVAPLREGARRTTAASAAKQV